MGLLDKFRKADFLKRNAPHDKTGVFMRVSNLDVRYEHFPALENLDFEMQAGERVAVVGPNGAGKSTLFKVVAGVLSPTHGKIQVFGHDPAGHICIAYLPQRNDVDWTFPVTVEDVVMMGRIGKIGLFGWPSSKDWEFVAECLQMVHLQSIAKRQISELSGGQQQRMFIARALAQEAELMLMDEPLSGLDTPSQEEVFRILDQLKERGVTVWVATHDLSKAAEEFDKVMLLNQRLIALGVPSEVLTEEHLRDAYGGHLQMIRTDDGMMILDDTTCCDD